MEGGGHFVVCVEQRGSYRAFLKKQISLYHLTINKSGSLLKCWHKLACVSPNPPTNLKLSLFLYTHPSCSSKPVGNTCRSAHTSNHTHPCTQAAQTPTEFWVISRRLSLWWVCFLLRVTDSKTPVKLYIPWWGGKESKTEGEYTLVNTALCVCTLCVRVCVCVHACVSMLKPNVVKVKRHSLTPI